MDFQELLQRLGLKQQEQDPRWKDYKVMHGAAPALGANVLQDLAEESLTPAANKAALSKLSTPEQSEAIRRANMYPLDPSHEARMLRAKEQGYDINNPYYHGTHVPNNFTDFVPSRQGNRGEGIYLTNNPEEASRYAGAHQTYPGVKASENAKVIPVFTKKALYDETRPDMHLIPEDQRLQDYRATSPTGNQYFPYEERPETVHRLIQDPTAIRSVNAMFDPAKKGSSNIMDAVAGASSFPLIQKILSNKPQEDQED